MDYVVLLQYSGADGIFYVAEIGVTDAEDEEDAKQSAIAFKLKPGDVLDDIAVFLRTTH
jgi:hypothetical protein